MEWHCAFSGKILLTEYFIMPKTAIQFFVGKLFQVTHKGYLIKPYNVLSCILPEQCKDTPPYLIWTRSEKQTYIFLSENDDVNLITPGEKLLDPKLCRLLSLKWTPLGDGSFLKRQRKLFILSHTQDKNTQTHIVSHWIHNWTHTDWATNTNKTGTLQTS